MKTWIEGSEITDIRTEYWEVYLQPYFRDAKLCSNSKDCGYKEDISSSKWQDANWSVQTSVVRLRLLFMLSDGTVVFWPFVSGYGDRMTYSTSVYIDVNGPKKPNTFCKDVFKFMRNTKTGTITPSAQCTKLMLKGGSNL